MTRHLMTPTECWARLQEQTSREDLLGTYLFGPQAPGAFCEQAEFDAFKQEASDAFRTASSAVSVVGSGRMGFSLSPDTEEDGINKGRSRESAVKLWKPIHQGSDIDIVVCDDLLFDDAWTECLEYDQRGVDPSFRRGFRLNQDALDRHRSIYQGVIILPELPKTLEFAKKWSGALASLSALPWDGTKRTCKGFLFREQFHAKLYYRRSFQQLCKRVETKVLPLPSV